MEPVLCGHAVTSRWTPASLAPLDLGFVKSEIPGGWGQTMQLIRVCFSSGMEKPAFLLKCLIVLIELNKTWGLTLICLKSPSSEFSDYTEQSSVQHTVVFSPWGTYG